jgi:hypothetical protein
MHSAIFSVLCYLSLSLLFILMTYAVSIQKIFSRSLLKLRSTLRFYFFSLVTLLAVFGLSFFMATSQFPAFELVIILFIGLTIQIQIQIGGESKLRNLSLKRIPGQWTVMRHWIVVLLGAGLLFGLNAGFSFVLLLLAKSYHLSELKKDLVLWLRAPFAIYACLVIFEFLRGFLLRFEFHGSPIKAGPLFNTITDIASRYKLRVDRIFSINLSLYNFNFILGYKTWLFISPEIVKTLEPKELEFLVVQGLLGSKLKLERQRILHYTIFSLGLFLPYFFAGQGLDYILPSLWALTVWKLLSLTLLIVQQILKRGIDSLQFATKCQVARELLHFDYGAMSDLYKKINNLNSVDVGPSVIFGLPQPKKLVPIVKRHIARARMHAAQPRQTLTPAALALVALTFFLLIGSFVILTPKYRLRKAAAEGNLAEVKKLLRSGMPADAVDILSNVTPTPLLAAAKAGKTSIVEILLQNGADPNKKVPLPFSPLDLAVQTGDLEMVKILVDHGAYIETRGYKGLTALMWASRLDNTPIMEFLIKHGAKLDARSDHKSTALMLAAQVGNINAVKLLIESGADVRFRDADNDSALGLAKRKHFIAIEKIITFAESIDRKPTSEKKQ